MAGILSLLKSRKFWLVAAPLVLAALRDYAHVSEDDASRIVWGGLLLAGMVTVEDFAAKLKGSR